MILKNYGEAELVMSRGLLLQGQPVDGGIAHLWPLEFVHQYDNPTDTNGDGYGDTVVDSTLNNGRADAFVRSSNDGEFLEYQFSADELEQFNAFRIKIVMSGTNEARAPRFKDLRTIALA